MRSGPQQSPFHASKIGSGDKQNQANHHATLATFGIVLTGRLGLRNELLSTFSVVGKDVWDEYARGAPAAEMRRGSAQRNHMRPHLAWPQPQQVIQLNCVRVCA